MTKTDSFAVILSEAKNLIIRRPDPSASLRMTKSFLSFGFVSNLEIGYLSLRKQWRWMC